MMKIIAIGFVLAVIVETIAFMLYMQYSQIMHEAKIEETIAEWEKSKALEELKKQ